MRIELVRDIAGWTAPCGCSPNQLGGLQYLASLVAAEDEAVPQRLLLSAGPLFFSTTTLACQAAEQKRGKAEVLAEAMNRIGLFAWAPGADDWANGQDGLRELARRSGAHLLAAGLTDRSGHEYAGGVLVQGGRLRVGIVGVSTPRTEGGRTPTGVSVPSSDELVAAVGRRVRALREDGADLILLLAALGYEGALEFAERVPDLEIVVAGSGRSPGAEADRGHAPAVVGASLVVEPPNHGQALVTIDVLLDPLAPPLGRGGVPLGVADAAAHGARVKELLQRIHSAQVFLQHNEGAPGASAASVRAGRGELARFQRELANLPPPAPARGHYLRYGLTLVEPARGTDEEVARLLDEYNARVGEDNRRAFADRTPLAVPEGGIHYVGASACAPCHAKVDEGWRSTRHARAYDTLVARGREYDLECVGCHVTGFERPGGSTLLYNEELRGIQCEECHGPGSLHAAAPTTPGLVIRAREPRWCVDSCHHPPQVEGFEPLAKIPLILGTAHGL